MQSGIYKIKNKSNHKIYIGSAKNIFSRWYKHKYLLRKNKHHNKKMQRAWNKYGEDHFIFEIVARCPSEYCIKLEQWFLDNLKPEYNLVKTAGNTLGYKMKPSQKKHLYGNKYGLGTTRSEETKEKMSAWQRGRKLSKTHIENISKGSSKKVYQYNLEGSFIKEWSSAKIAGDYFKVHRNSICMAALGKIQTSCNFKWSYKKSDFYEKNVV